VRIYNGAFGQGSTMNLRAIRGTVRSAVRALLDENKARSREEVIVALMDLAELRAGGSEDDDVFGEKLTEIGFSPAQVPKVLAALDERARVQHAVLEAWADCEPRFRWTDLQDRMDDFIASRECLDLVIDRSPPVVMRAWPAGNEFDPFIASLSWPQMMNEVRAHALAMLALYVRSGHAEKDLNTAIGDTEDEFIQGLVAGMVMFRQGEHMEGWTGMVDVRLTDLLLPVHVVADPNTGLPVAIDATHSSYSGNLGDKRWPDQRDRVDGVMRDVINPSLLHSVAVCAGELNTFGDWLARYTTAITNGIDLEVPPFEKGDQLVRPMLMNVSLAA
jgi:hypothetical protein